MHHLITAPNGLKTSVWNFDPPFLSPGETAIMTEIIVASATNHLYKLSKDSGVETLAWIAFQIRTSRINKLIFSTSNEKWPFHRFLLKIKKS